MPQLTLPLLLIRQQLMLRLMQVLVAVARQLRDSVRNHEPAGALDGGLDGLDAIRTIGQGAAKALAPGGWLLLEHHHDQSTAVMALLRAAGLDHVQAHPDLEGHARFASARRVPA